MKRATRAKSTPRDSAFEYGSWTPRTHDNDTGSLKRFAAIRKPRGRPRKAKPMSPPPESQATDKTASVTSDSHEVDLFSSELSVELDDFTFEAILGMGEQPAASQLVVTERPSPSTLLAFPCLAPSPPKEQKAFREPWVTPPKTSEHLLKNREGGFHVVTKATRVLEQKIKKLKVVHTKTHFLSRFGSLTSRFDAINTMINTPAKAPSKCVVKPIGVVFNAQLVRAC